jgi:hypothetical protein
MSRSSEHLAEMRVAVAERCSLPEARRRLAKLKHSACVAALHKARGGQGSFFEGAASRVTPPSPNLSPEGERGFWWEQY